MTKISWPDIHFGPINLWSMPRNMDSRILYNKIVEENLAKGHQIHLVVNEFRDVIYIQLRKYFLSYEGEFVPSREGVSMEASMENIYALLDGLFDIVSQGEAREIIEHYAAKISDLSREP